LWIALLAIFIILNSKGFFHDAWWKKAVKLFAYIGIFVLIAAVSWPPLQKVKAYDTKEVIRTETVKTEYGDVRGVVLEGEKSELFAGIPYELNDNTERHYQVIFHIVFTLMGQFIQSEVRSARGRADAVVQAKDAVYVFEFKWNGPAEAALKQIEERGYLIPYSLDGRRLVKIGVDFDKETRNINQYIVEG
jgi:hypothetical protein